MSDQQDPTKPVPNSEKFKPQNVAGSKADKGRSERNIEDVSRGSEGDSRRNSQNRSSDQG